MIALVTGGAGFIGSHLVEKLVRDGHNIRVLDDLSTGNEANLSPVRASIQFIEGSILDSRLMTQAMAGVEAVFHLAGKISVSESFELPAEYERVNVHGTALLLATARKAGVRQVILSSTCAVYGDAADLPIRETMPTKPLSPYARNKVAAERLGYEAFLAGGPAFTALRYFNVYGARQNPRSAYSGVISRFAAALQEGERPVIYGDGSQTRDFIYVGDVVRANLLAAQQRDRASAIYNVGTGRETSIGDLLLLMVDAARSVRTLGRVDNLKPEYKSRRADEILRSAADVALAKHALAFSAGTDLRTGLRHLAAALSL